MASVFSSSICTGVEPNQSSDIHRSIHIDLYIFIYTLCLYSFHTSSIMKINKIICCVYFVSSENTVTSPHILVYRCSSQCRYYLLPRNKKYLYSHAIQPVKSQHLLILIK